MANKPFTQLLYKKLNYYRDSARRIHKPIFVKRHKNGHYVVQDHSRSPISVQ